MWERSGWWAGFRAECLGWRLVGSWVDGWVKGWESAVTGFGWSGPKLERAIPGPSLPWAYCRRTDRQVHTPETTRATDYTLSLTVIGCAVRNTAAQLQAVREVQQQAGDLQAPVLWSMAPDFLGETVQQLATRDSVRAVLSSSELTKWRGLRQEDSARWAGACSNRFLLRNPHEATIGNWTFAERMATPDERIWGAPSYFVAAVMARSVIETGWPTRCTGLQAGSVEGRPLAEQMPVEAALNEAAVEDLADGGILALSCVRGRDQVILLRAPSTHEPQRFGNREQANAESRKMSGLPYQLLAARISEAILRHKPTLVGDGQAAAMQQRFERFLHALVADTGSGAACSVTVEPDPEQENTNWVHCTIRTGQQVLGGTELNFSLHT